MPTSRPEFENPPEVYYNAIEARKYTVSTRVRHIQRMMTLRALELLNLPRNTSSSPTLSSSTSLRQHPVQDGALLLDVGCGSGISGEVLTEQGHAWIGVDISKDMLQMAKENEEVVALIEQNEEEEEEPSGLSRKNNRGDITGNGKSFSSGMEEESFAHPRESCSDVEDDKEELEGSEDLHQEETDNTGAVVPAPAMAEVLHLDIGTGLPLRPGSFDGCVSISVLQWLCHSSKRGEVPQRRLRAFFQSLYNALRRGAKAVFQFYPSSPEQIDMISKAAMKCGFNGGVVVDYPHSTKAKKHYLVLQAGQVAGVFIPPPALGEEGIGDSDCYEDLENETMSNDSEREEGEEGSRYWSHARVGGRDREKMKRSRSEHRFQESRKRRRKDNRPVTGTKEWVLLKKAERRRRGEKTTEDTKYTMRKRKPRF